MNNLSNSQDNWDLLRQLVRDKMQFETAAAYIYMMDSLKDDRLSAGGETLLGFFRCPAAKGNHHAHEGGLVRHILEMWITYDHFKKHPLYDSMLAYPYVSDERVLRAIINHDLHKAFRTFVLISEEPWSADYSKDPSDQLMTKDIKTISLLSQFKIPMDAEQLNALCWAEGGFADIKPRWCSVLAKLCYLLDEFSGNIISRVDQGTLLDHRNSVR